MLVPTSSLSSTGQSDLVVSEMSVLTDDVTLCAAQQIASAPEMLGTTAHTGPTVTSASWSLAVKAAVPMPTVLVPEAQQISTSAVVPGQSPKSQTEQSAGKAFDGKIVSATSDQKRGLPDTGDGVVDTSTPIQGAEAQNQSSTPRATDAVGTKGRAATPVLTLATKPMPSARTATPDIDSRIATDTETVRAGAGNPSEIAGPAVANSSSHESTDDISKIATSRGADVTILSKDAGANANDAVGISAATAGPQTDISSNGASLGGKKCVAAAGSPWAFANLSKADPGASAIASDMQPMLVPAVAGREPFAVSPAPLMAVTVAPDLSGSASELPKTHQMLDSGVPLPASPPAAAVIPGSPADLQRTAQVNAEMHVGMHTDGFGTVEIHSVVQQSQVGISIHSDRDLSRWFNSEVPSLETGLNQHHLNLTAVVIDGSRSSLQTAMGFQQGSPRQNFSQLPTTPMPSGELTESTESSAPETLSPDLLTGAIGARVSILV